ncbi:hypothetical protein, partial [Ralstonia solanacearum]|uniref:hypothetical protein n=1 Tax=Ralstonia solanacearum TaxID=305 RepID=UPI0019D374E3
RLPKENFFCNICTPQIGDIIIVCPQPFVSWGKGKRDIRKFPPKWGIVFFFEKFGFQFKKMAGARKKGDKPGVLPVFFRIYGRILWVRFLGDWWGILCEMAHPSGPEGRLCDIYKAGVMLKKLYSPLAVFQANIGERVLANGHHVPYLCSVLCCCTDSIMIFRGILWRF